MNWNYFLKKKGFAHLNNRYAANAIDEFSFYEDLTAKQK
jgi:hypothetical protein